MPSGQLLPIEECLFSPFLVIFQHKYKVRSSINIKERIHFYIILNKMFIQLLINLQWYFSVFILYIFFFVLLNNLRRILIIHGIFHLSLFPFAWNSFTLNIVHCITATKLNRSKNYIHMCKCTIQSPQAALYPFDSDDVPITREK